jgi:hypothetical protein
VLPSSRDEEQLSEKKKENVDQRAWLGNGIGKYATGNIAVPPGSFTVEDERRRKKNREENARHLMVESLLYSSFGNGPIARK